MDYSAWIVDVFFVMSLVASSVQTGRASEFLAQTKDVPIMDSYWNVLSSIQFYSILPVLFGVSRYAAFNERFYSGIIGVGINIVWAVASFLTQHSMAKFRGEVQALAAAGKKR